MAGRDAKPEDKGEAEAVGAEGSSAGESDAATMRAGKRLHGWEEGPDGKAAPKNGDGRARRSEAATGRAKGATAAAAMAVVAVVAA